MRETLLEACLNNQRYDSQCEDSRGKYLYELIHDSGNAEFYRDKVLASLEEANPERDREQQRSWYQRLELTRYFAQAGDSDTRAALYNVLFRDALVHDFSAAADIVALDGLAGLLTVLGKMDGLEPDEYDEQAEALVWKLKERDGDEATEQQIERAAQDTPTLAALLHAVREAKQARDEARNQRKAQPRLTYQQVREKIHAAAASGYISGLWSWGLEAADEELALVAADLLAESDPLRQRHYLWLFRKRVFPLDFHSLLPLVRREDRRLSSAATAALANITHPDIREFALRLLPEPLWRDQAVDLMTANPGPDDFALLAYWLQRTEADLMHWMDISSRGYAEAHYSAAAIPCLLFLYENTPCSLCRGAAVRMLAKHDTLPEWMPQECLHDADSDTRQVAANYSDSASDAHPATDGSPA